MGIEESCLILWCSTPGQKPLGTVPNLLFPYCGLLYTDFCICFLNLIDLGFSDVFMVVFSNGHERLPPHLHR
jgi:hypothetical protein